MASEDRIKSGRQEIKKYAISLVKWFTRESLKNYVEPERLGVQKGNQIGFSLKKERSTCLMMLYPNCLRLNGIANLSGVPSGSLRTWKRERDFIDEVIVGSYCLSEMIQNEIEFHVMEKYFPLDPEIEKSIGKLRLHLNSKNTYYYNPQDDPQDSNNSNVLMYLSDILPFLNSSISLPIMKWLLSQTPGDIGTREYLGLAYRILRNAHVTKDKEFKKWARRPAILEIHKKWIEDHIDFLMDPEIAKLPRDRIERSIKLLKKDIFETLDILAS
ncbi:MAG: hypothetical protein ABSH06_05105 [Thermodesulfobacteriota bacterium]|jgi:hypothetical protein